MQIEEIKDQICDVCHKMWQLGWVAANDGNVSVRLEDGTFLATPTGMSKSFITPDKLLRIDAKGNVLEGAEGLRPSSEIKMHLRCYEKRADVNAVVHAHPPAATGFAVAHRPMDMYNIEQLSAVTGRAFTTLHVLGGGTKDRLLCQMTADCCGLTVKAGPVEATALGNIMIQLKALGLLDSITQGRRLIAETEVIKTYTPSAQNYAEWNAAYDRFKTLL